MAQAVAQHEEVTVNPSTRPLPRVSRHLASGLAALVLLAAACAPAAPPSPTAAPAKPTEPPKPAATAAPAKPTEAPAAKPAPTAPAKPAEAKPAASPAAKPAASPAAKPAEAKPAASPAAKAAFDAKSIADFYRGKTVKIIVGLSAGGGYDLTSRLIARYLPKYIPGEPTVIVENRPGAGSALAANTIYNTEPKDGTIIGNISPTLVLRQALGQPGVEYDGARIQWLGATAKDFTTCLVRSDTGVTSIQDSINGKEIILATLGPGDNSHDVPALMNASLGTRFKLVPGYQGAAQFRLAVDNKEADGFCITFISGMLIGDTERLSGANPAARIIVSLAERNPDHPFLKDVPTADSLARDAEAKTLLRAVDAAQIFNKPYFVAPGVPADRVAALRAALASTYADPAFVDEAKKARFDISPSSGEEVERVVRDVLNIPPPLLDKLKAVLN
jgi:tripartite-type tricarboxylate transporter receptor subunit TctC